LIKGLAKRIDIGKRRQGGEGRKENPRKGTNQVIDSGASTRGEEANWKQIDPENKS